MRLGMFRPKTFIQNSSGPNLPSSIYIASAAAVHGN